MEFKKLNSEVIKLFDKLNKSFDNKSASLNERVNILDHKIDHIISFFDHCDSESTATGCSMHNKLYDLVLGSSIPRHGYQVFLENCHHWL